MRSKSRCKHAAPFSIERNIRYIIPFSLSQLKKEKSKGNKASDKNSYWEKLSGSLFVSIGTTKLFDYPIRDIAFNLKKDYEDFKVNNFSAVFPGNTKINLNGHFGSEFDVFEGNMKFDTQDFSSYAQWSSLKNINFFPEDRFSLVSVCPLPKWI